MIKNLRILLVLAAAFSFVVIDGQDVIRSNTLAGVCYAGKNVNRIYIPPPKEFFQKDRTKGADIKVIYSGFTSATMTAFNYAVSIMASILPADAKFTIKATLEPITNQGVLGQTSVPVVYRGSSINALYPSVYYPVALAEKIAGYQLNFDNEADIELTLNSRATWYTGTSGNTPASMYDMVTVVIHELCHGLGFFDSFTVTNGVGSYGSNGGQSYPPVTVYDNFIETKKGLKLIDPLNFANNSTLLGSQLTGGQLYFDGPVIFRYTSGNRPRIFAPAEWDPGSSISHLDEDITPQIDALMTPYIALGEAIHSPGQLNISILGELGWINTRLLHNPPGDTESPVSQVSLKAVIESDTTYYRDNVGLVYSFDKFVSRDTLYIVPPVSDDTFRINLSIPSYETLVSYYFIVTDAFNRNYNFPSDTDSFPYSIYIGTDTVKPVLNHSKLGSYYYRIESLLFSAISYDNIGVDTVYLEYRKNNGSLKKMGLKNDSLDFYNVLLDLKPELLVPGDSIQYRIIAVDKSSMANSRKVPASGLYTVHFEDRLPVLENYQTDFSDAGNHFLNTGFSVTTPNQFLNPALHTLHPYESPDKDNSSIEYTAYLRYPIKTDPSGLYISFDEIVLVEPGADGSVFGSANFFDYVIVEASKNSGTTWFPLADGYDCRIVSIFETKYNSSFSGMNSSFIGTPDLFRKHTIDIRTPDKYTPGDTLQIRFRLFSDPYAHGWGWAIDNLIIGSVAAGVEKLTGTEFTVFPNPGNGEISVRPGDSALGSKISYTVYNAAGMKLNDGLIGYGTDNMINISQYPPGMYIILFRNGKVTSYVKYTKLR